MRPPPRSSDKHRGGGGRGWIRDYRIVSGEAYLAATFGRHKFPSWAVDGGREGSRNEVRVRQFERQRSRGRKVWRYRLVKGEVARLIIGSGGGRGDPHERDVDARPRSRDTRGRCPQLRSPFHGLLSGRILLLSLARPDGAAAVIPLAYARRTPLEVLAFVAQPNKRRWWRALLTNPHVSVRLAGEDRQVTARVVQEETEVIAGLHLLVEQARGAGRKLGLNPDAVIGESSETAFARAAANTLMVILELAANSSPAR